MSAKDLRPSRDVLVKEQLENFVRHYFDQNPISQMSVISTSDRTATKHSELSGNAKAHVEAITRSLPRPRGVPSIQSALVMASGILRHIPDYGHRELLLVFGSLSTCDAGNIFKTIEVSTLSLV
jgi:transcription initiation factor TFIIH subunit 2